jgi:asparaginyl-tRNA synthetase
MKATTVKYIFRNHSKMIDSSLSLSGWVKTIRSSKNFGFIEVNDGSFFNNIQVVFEDKLDNFSEISKLTTGSSLQITGKLVQSLGKGQLFEINADSVEILGIADHDFPLQKKRHSREFLRTIAHLRPRTNLFRAVFRVRSLLAYALHKYFNEQGFVYIHTPIITGNDCEGAGEMFKVTTLNLKNIPLNQQSKVKYEDDFFGKETNLTVSGQLAVENFCMAFQKVYTFGPTFRAENSNTARHASEFWMIEPEIAFAELEDNMNIAEEMMKYITNYILENAPEEMAFFNKWVNKGLLDRLTNIINSDFERITYTKAVELLQKADKKFEFPITWGADLQTEHERYLTEIIFKKPTFVTDYPREIKAFYMRINDDNKTVSAMDLLVPGVGEIIGGSQREERHDILLQKIKDSKLNPDDYWWYLDLRRYGTAKHSGFGLGFERALMYMTGVENIRDVIPFPRTPKNAEF